MWPAKRQCRHQKRKSRRSECQRVDSNLKEQSVCLSSLPALYQQNKSRTSCSSMNVTDTNLLECIAKPCPHLPRLYPTTQSRKCDSRPSSQMHVEAAGSLCHMHCNTTDSQGIQTADNESAPHKLSINACLNRDSLHEPSAYWSQSGTGHSHQWIRF